ncbi:hypothetical protein ACQ4PT_045119 [Festuca glaucescens]
MMPSSSRVSSWRVTYAVRPIPGDHRNFPFLDGVLVAHHARARLLLLDSKEFVVDSRALGAKEVIVFGGAVAFPQHDARIPSRPLPLESLFGGGGASDPSPPAPRRIDPTPFPASIDELVMPCPRVLHQHVPPVDLTVARPSRPREDHIIDPGRWKDWLVPRSPEAGILGRPSRPLGTENSQSLDLGCGPNASSAMATRDPSTCPDPTLSTPRNNGGRCQAHGRGFFYMPDHSSAKQSKERASSVVITVLEGNISHRELEKEFNIAFGDSWRCTARSLGPNQYSMRFPTAVEVERAVYYGAKMRLKTVDATVRLSTWTASIGAKAVLQKAWVKVSNIPLDKRCDANVFYAGGLVGVSLELDPSTLHKPEYVRVLIGCHDVEMIPASAEGCLGDNFYDFFYEIDKIVVGGPPKANSSVVVGGSLGAPSPKRARYDQSSNIHEESSEEQNLGSQTETVGHGRKHDDVVVTDVNTESDSQESNDDEAGSSELLIETITREHEAKVAASQDVPQNKWLVPCPILQEKRKMPPADTLLTTLLLPYSQWPSLPTITEMNENSSSPPVGSPAYVVQSPDSIPMEEDRVTSEDTRCSTRLLDNANKDIMEKVEDKKRLSMGAQKMMTAASTIYASHADSAAPGQMLMITGA